MNEILIERNRAAMRRFEICINTNDLSLAKELISEKAAFVTPVSPTPLMGAEGYMSVVTMRQHLRRPSVLPLKALSDQS